MKAYRAISSGLFAMRIIVAAAIGVAVAVGVPCIFSKMQLVPAIMACSVVWLAIWFAVSALFGRLYCSTVCPTGALIDLISKLSKRRRGTHFSYSAPKNRLRVAVLLSVIVCAAAGISVAVAVFDPYSAFARMVAACRRPAAIGLAGLAGATATLLIIAVISWRRGRLLCNTICPVGTLLGLMSKYSLYHPDINTDLCVNCGRCADKCASECIDLKSHVIDLSRCTVCFDCMAVCPNDAITFRRGRHRLTMTMMQRVVGNAGVSAINRPDSPLRPIDRRMFLSTGLMSAVAMVTAAKSAISADGSSSSPHRLLPLNYVLPPGTSSREDFFKRCTACGACISACPTGVIKASSNEFGVRHALTPVMNFDRSFCLVDCVICTEICPTKALNPLTVDEKLTSPIGKARIEPANCILYADSVACSVCVRRCPLQAISIIRDNNGKQVPKVDNELCTGCGVCSYACPSQPYKAIIIEGK